MIFLEYSRELSYKKIRGIMEFSEKMKKLVTNGATLSEVASSFGLDVTALSRMGEVSL